MSDKRLEMSNQQPKKIPGKPIKTVIGNQPSANSSKKPSAYSSIKKTPQTLFSSLDKLVERMSPALLYLILGLCLLFSILLFQARMDVGGDDSGYVLRA